MARLRVLLSVLVFAAAACYAAEPAGQVYWNKVLPNTPMPSAIKDLLTTDEFTEDKSAAVSTGKGTNVNAGQVSVGVNTGKGTSVNVGKGGVGVNTGTGGRGTSVNVGHPGVGVNVGHGGHSGVGVNVGHGGVGVNVGHGGHSGVGVNVGHGGVTVGVKIPPKKKPIGPFNYNYAATETQVHDDPNVALFFLEKDLQPGTKMTLHFTPTTSGAAFVSRREANSVPFSSAKLPQILNHFSVEPNSAEAEAMKTTLTECEDPAMAGESKYCATSLESMVEFSTHSLGTRKVTAVSTTTDKQNSPKQQYTILSPGVYRLSNNLVVCHAQNYAYAVFYCHTTHSTRAYEVSMAGEDGTKVEAVAVCHSDTARWNPKHVAFQVLGVKPGTVPVCHFLPQDHVVWSPKRTRLT